MNRLFSSVLALSIGIAPLITFSVGQSALGQVQNFQQEEAERLNQQVIQLYEQGKYDQAIPLAQRALEIRKHLLGSDHPDVAASLNNLAGLYREQGRYSEAELLYKESLVIREKALGANHPDVATSLNNLALLYQIQGRYSEAEPLYQKALIIYEKTLGLDNLSVSTTLNNLAFLYQIQGRYDRAEPLYKRALVTREKTLGPAHPNVAATLNNLAELYSKQGRYSEAELISKRALAIYEKTLGPTHSNVAATLNNLALLYQYQSKYRQAESLYQQALSISKKTFDRGGEATILNNLGGIYNAIGQYDKALSFYQQTLVIQREVKDLSGEAALLNNIGAIYRSTKQFSKALELYQQSLIIRREVGDRSGEATSLNNIGAVYNALGQYDKALKYYQQALTIRREIGDQLGEASTLNNIGTIYNAVGNYTKSLGLFNQVLPLFRAVGDRPGEATALSNIGKVYLANDQAEQALKYYNQALLLFQAVGDRSSEASVLDSVGQAYLELNKPEQALRYFEQAVLIFRKIGDRSSEADTLNNIGKAYLKLGQTEKALKCLNDALHILKELNKNTSRVNSLSSNKSNTNQLRKPYFYNLSNINTQYSDYQLKENFRSTNPDPTSELIKGYKQQIYEYSEIYKITGELSNRYAEASYHRLVGELLLKEKKPLEAVKSFNSAQEISRELGDRYGESTILTYTAKAYRDANQLNNAIDNLKKAVTITLSIRGEISKGNRQRFLQLSSRRDLIAGLVTLLIAKKQYDEAFEWFNLSGTAELADYTRLVDAKVANNNVQLTINRWNQKNQQLQSLRQQLKANFSLEVSQQMRSLEKELLKEAEEISKQFPEVAELFEFTPQQIAQLKASIPQGTVVVQPVLLNGEEKEPNRIAFFILSSSRLVTVKVVEIKFQDLDALINQYLQQLQNRYSSEFATTQEKLYNLLFRPIETEVTELSPVQISFILTGKLRHLPFETLYDSKTNQYLIQKYPISYLTRLSTHSLLANRTKDWTEQRKVLAVGNPIPTGRLGLPGAETEVKGIAQALPGSETFIRNQATLNTFKVQAPRFSLIHLATHGCFQSGGCSKLGLEENTLLFADQRFNIADAALLGLQDVQLITLSACQTALETNSNGEEIAGLAYLFERAGARATIASLWSAEDTTTQVIMVKFYENLKQGMSKGEALRQAKMSQINSHPFFWAPFVLIGDPR